MRAPEKVAMETTPSRILIVDDEFAIVKMLGEILRLQGYLTIEAYGGKEAIEAAQEEEPDLILLDIMMPDMDGIEVCRRLSADPVTRNVPIILVTATKKSEMLGEGIDAGALDFVEKPFQNTELLARVRSALRLKNYTDNLERLVGERTQAIALSEKRYREIVEATEDLIFQADPLGVATFVNASGAAALGFDREEMTGLPSLELIVPEDREGVLNSARLLREGNPIRQHEARIRDGFGVVRDYVWNLAPRFDDDGRFIGSHGIGRDFTQMKELETKLVEANRLKSQFLANISHELRTPLNSIIGFSQVILRGIDGPVSQQMKEDLLQIHSSGRHLLELINELLNFVKIEAGKVELNQSPMTLKDLVDEVIPVFRSQIMEKGLTLDSAVPDDIPQVWVDRPKIKQVLINLIGNAVKFTDRGSIEVRAETLGESVRVYVRDTGIGIPSKAVDYIFEEFRQVDGSPTRQRGGAGLGLAICKKIIELHGGEVGVSSREDDGSTFHFDLPLWKAQKAVRETA